MTSSAGGGRRPSMATRDERIDASRFLLSVGHDLRGAETSSSGTGTT